MARQYIRSVIIPPVLQLRRLMIAESGRFPDLARAYYERAPERVIAALAAALQQFAGRERLRLEDPLLAASHLAFLILGSALDRAMFCGDESVADANLHRYADAAVRVFLAAYGRIGDIDGQ